MRADLYMPPWIYKEFKNSSFFNLKSFFFCFAEILHLFDMNKGTAGSKPFRYANGNYNSKKSYGTFDLLIKILFMLVHIKGIRDDIKNYKVLFSMVMNFFFVFHCFIQEDKKRIIAVGYVIKF